MAAVVAEPSVAAETPAAPKQRRRRLTIGTFAFVFALGLIGTITLTLVAVHARSGYFVGFDGDAVVVYQGQQDKLLWFDPTVKASSTKKRQDLDQTMIDVINSKPTFSSSEQAASFIANEVTPTTVATSTTTTTTTVPASSTTAVTVTSIAGP